MGKLPGFIALLLTTFALTGCESTALRDAVNLAFPPVNHVDHQVTAVKASAAELASFQEAPTFYLSLALDDLRQILPSSLAARIEAAPGKDIEASAVSVQMGLGRQEVVVNTDFALRLPTEDTRAAGTAEVHCTASVERGSLVLRPSGSSLRLTSLRYRGDKAPAVIEPVIDGLLKTFMDNVNGAIAAQRIPLRFHAMESIDLAQALRQTPGVTSSTGTVVTAGVALGSSAILIDPRAIRVLGNVVFLTPEHYGKAFHLLEERVNSRRTDSLSSEELAALAACMDPGEFARTIHATDPSTVDAMCKEAEKGIASIKTEHFPSAADAANALAASFPKYYDGFMQLAQTVEPGKRLLADGTLIALSRPAVATGIQAILAGASASATYSQSIPQQGFNELITPTTTDLNCAENAGGCDSDFSYPPYQPRGCDSNCSGMDRKCAFGICVDVPWVDAGCLARKGPCETLKESERQAYEAEKAAAKAAWTANKIACETRKAATKAGCDINQGWLDAWASKEIARVEGSASVPEFQLFAAMDGLTLAPDFSSLTVQYRLSADANVSASAKVTPLNGGHLICAMPANLSLKAKGHVEALTKTITASLQPVQRGGEELVLSYDISGQQAAFTFSPALPVALFDQNTDKLALSCPAPVAIVSSIPGFSAALVGLKVALRISPNLFAATKTVDIPGKTIPFKIPSQEISMDPRGGTASRKVLLRPEWGQNAILFSARLKE